MKSFQVHDFTIGKNQPLALILGPCVIEDEKHTLYMAEELKKMTSRFPFPLIFKASYDKANRSSVRSFRGPGIKKGLSILQKVQKEFDLPVITDIHSPDEAKAAAEYVDILQIPAFLCRQTDLILAAAATMKPVNIKKGQFVAPWDMKNVIEKMESLGNQKILLTDRGTTFGYNNLVSDMRAIPIMQELGYPVCFDASHSVQLPGSLGGASGGERKYIPTLAKAAVAAGCNALFIECHSDPANAKSDATTVVPFDMLNNLLEEIERIHFALQQAHAR
ncbi:MAG TPA: 3-deoxy-8-phosphooctulonate synthase [Chlamydiales bacterium]|nr:3-deoxy-8-phosphooctulonate synthase [Chlamydiales bacterium]